MKFSKNTKDRLQHYVYGLVDPRDSKIFYIGKASGNDRAFDHLKSSIFESKKDKLIRAIRAAKAEPRVEILRYGLDTERMALEVEGALIDAVGLEHLTNEVRGHGVRRGRMFASEVERLYASRPVNVGSVREPCMIFFVQNTYSPTMKEHEIYDCVRQFWHQVSAANRENLQYPTALGVVEGVVVRVYSIAAWFPAGATDSSRPFEGATGDKWEFVGKRLEKHPLLGRLLVDDAGKTIRATQKGYSYLPLRKTSRATA